MKDPDILDMNPIKPRLINVKYLHAEHVRPLLSRVNLTSQAHVLLPGVGRHS